MPQQIKTRKKIEKVKSSSNIIKKKQEVEVHSENNINLIEKISSNPLENSTKNEIKTQKRNILIKKSTDAKYILSSDKSQNLKNKKKDTNTKEKELETLNENLKDNRVKQKNNFMINEDIENDENIKSLFFLDFLFILKRKHI